MKHKLVEIFKSFSKGFLIWNVMILFTVILAGGTTVVAPDKLEDFKAAVKKVDDGERGCVTIPYSDIRSDCESQGGYVHEWCDGGRGPITCGSENLTRQAKANVEKEKKNVEDLKEKKRNLEDQKSHATEDSEKDRLGREIEQVDRDIYEGGKSVDLALSALDTRKKLVDDAIYTINKCIDYRRAVMNIFAAAGDKVRGETDDEIVPMARKLRDKYESEKPGHEIQITDKKNALETCNNSRP